MTEWTRDALCAQTDPEAFFPEKGGSTLEARKVCEKCPVLDQCREYAINDSTLVGVWGGTVTTWRIAERKRRGLPPTLEDALRRRVVAAYRAGLTAEEVAREFEVNERSVYRWAKEAA